MFAEAAVVSAAIMLTHIVLRPVGLQLNRITFTQSATTQTDYLFTIKCRTEVENHIRVLLMQMLGNDDKLLLQSLTSDENLDLPDVLITAEIKAMTPQDSLMERVASRLTIETKVSKVSWEITGKQTDL